MVGLDDHSGSSTSASGESSTDCELFGKYELGKLIGCGAFAKVYHARNARTGQSVAIKAVCKHKVVKGGLVENIKREISIMSQLRHPHIVKLFEVLATKTKIYFVMEFAKGGELFTKVAEGRFSENLSRRYFHQLISAVRYCHSRGVFHRDLKPENILLDENWDLKVTDFGLSAVKDQIRPDGLLHTVCGTPAYVAPEVLVKKGYDGAKIDIWSCGIILFVLNAGYLPFNDTNLMGLYRKIYKGQFRCPKWTSPDLKLLISRLLGTNPETRITIDEIFRDPWFKKGHKAIKLYSEDFESKNDNNTKCLNAFDIISFSSGCDLSGLISTPEISISGERFISACLPEIIIQKVEDAAKTESLAVTRRKDWGVLLEGRNGELVFAIEIYQLTENLVVVEIKKRDISDGSSKEIWKDKLRRELIYQP